MRLVFYACMALNRYTFSILYLFFRKITMQSHGSICSNHSEVIRKGVSMRLVFYACMALNRYTFSILYLFFRKITMQSHGLNGYICKKNGRIGKDKVHKKMTKVTKTGRKILLSFYSI